MTRKKRRPLKADVSDYTGVVLPCPLCDQRTWQPNTAAAWRWLYYHLRRAHGQMASAQLTQNVMRRYMYARHSSDS